MEPPSIFSTIAEISIALIGFASVIFALKRDKLSKNQSYRLNMLFLTGAIGLISGFTPYIGFMLVSETHAWRLATCVFLFFFLSVNFYAWTQRRYHKGSSNKTHMIAKALQPIIVLCVVFMLIALCWQTTLLPASHLLGAILTLLIGVYHFYMLAVSKIAE